MVELIVVLIVLALFSSMFGLSVSVARDKSKQSTCAAHLRHVAAGWRQYAADHDGVLVPLSVRLRDTGKSWEDIAAWPTLMKGGGELAWNADWEGAVQRGATSWSGELRIPLAALKGAGAATWRGNVSRYEKPNAEYSTWSPIPEATADQPARFGILRMQ